MFVFVGKMYSNCFITGQASSFFYKLQLFWEICEFTIKIIHQSDQTQSKQRHFTSLNMANVDSAFLASI
jgi:hypothetical protein